MRRKSEFFEFGEWLKTEKYGGVFISTIIYQVGKCLDHQGYALEKFLRDKPSSYYSNLRKWKKYKESIGETFEIEIPMVIPDKVVKAIDHLVSSGWSPTKLEKTRISNFVEDGKFLITPNGVLEKRSFSIIQNYFRNIETGDPLLPYQVDSDLPMLKKQIKRVLKAS
jgi:hypothetical protein